MKNKNNKSNCFISGFEPEAIIALMGDFPGREVLKKFTKIPLYAADGAGEQLLDNGIEPDLIIGDMDSFGRSRYYKYFPKDKIITIEDQETNDFEKCLLYCSEKQFSKIGLTGFNGGFLEHSLNNWSVFMKYSEMFDLRIIERGRIARTFGAGEYEIKAKKGDSVSIIPQTSAIITTENFVYPLNCERLEMGYREGLENRLAEDCGKIIVHSGRALVFLPFQI